MPSRVLSGCRPQMARYDAKADARSWAEMRAFFDEIFGSSQA